jgi:hypothetical protein
MDACSLGSRRVRGRPAQRQRPGNPEPRDPRSALRASTGEAVAGRAPGDWAAVVVRVGVGWDELERRSILGVGMDAAGRDSTMAPAGATMSVVATREIAKRLLDELPDSEIDPVVEFIVSRRQGDPDLEALLDEEADELLGELDAREREAGTRTSKA